MLLRPDVSTFGDKDISFTPFEQPFCGVHRLSVHGLKYWQWCHISIYVDACACSLPILIINVISAWHCESCFGIGLHRVYRDISYGSRICCSDKYNAVFALLMKEVYPRNGADLAGQHHIWRIHVWSSVHASNTRDNRIHVCSVPYCLCDKFSLIKPGISIAAPHFLAHTSTSL